tara:strand:+ start:76 stop:1023 length:948 start_codon:yes stop_codon:yes gene_type:complete
MWKVDLPPDYDFDLPDENAIKKSAKELKLKNKKKFVGDDLKIYPIKIDESKLNQGESKYPLSTPVHLHLIIGRVKAGKSLLVNNLYLSNRFYGDDYKTKVLISSSAYNDAINKHMIDDFDFVFTEYSEGLLEELIKLVEKDEGDGRWLILLDDIIGDVKFSRGKVDAISSLISKFRHIGNGEVEGKLALCITTQYFKYISTIARNNATAYYIMGTFAEAELKKIAESLSFFGGNDKAFLEIFKRSRKEQYDFLYCSVEHLEARRNHDELIWSKDNGWEQSWEGEKDMLMEEKPNKKNLNNNYKSNGDIPTTDKPV